MIDEPPPARPESEPAEPDLSVFVACLVREIKAAREVLTRLREELEDGGSDAT